MGPRPVDTVAWRTCAHQCPRRWEAMFPLFLHSVLREPGAGKQGSVGSCVRKGLLCSPPALPPGEEGRPSLPGNGTRVSDTVTLPLASGTLSSAGRLEARTSGQRAHHQRELCFPTLPPGLTPNWWPSHPRCHDLRAETKTAVGRRGHPVSLRTYGDRGVITGIWLGPHLPGPASQLWLPWPVPPALRHPSPAFGLVLTVV